jgi:hypothetical protein
MAASIQEGGCLGHLTWTIYRPELPLNAYRCKVKRSGKSFGSRSADVVIAYIEALANGNREGILGNFARWKEPTSIPFESRPVSVSG